MASQTSPDDGAEDSEAKPEQAAKATPAKAAKGGFMGLLIAIVVTVIAGGAAGFVLAGSNYTLLHGKIEAQIKKQAQDPVPAATLLSTIRALPPIITNIAAPEGLWVRLESSLVLNAPTGPETDVLAKQIEGDFVAFLRAENLSQLQGSLGLLHLRQDLAERAATRSEGRIKDVIIESLVIQ